MILFRWHWFLWNLFQHFSMFYGRPWELTVTKQAAMKPLHHWMDEVLVHTFKGWAQHVHVFGTKLTMEWKWKGYEWICGIQLAYIIPQIPSGSTPRQLYWSTTSAIAVAHRGSFESSNPTAVEDGTAGSPWSWERTPLTLRVILKSHVGDHDF